MIKCFTGEQYNGICVCVHLTQTCYAQNTCAEMEKNMSQQQYDISPGNKNLIVAAKAGLVVSIINYAFCLISICVVIGIFISQLVNIETGSSSGWFLFMVPVAIGMYILSCVPDTLSFLFAEENGISHSHHHLFNRRLSHHDFRSYDRVAGGVWYHTVGIHHIQNNHNPA